MALDAHVSGRWPVTAIVAFSGSLASPEPFKSALGTHVPLILGEPGQGERRSGAIAQTISVFESSAILRS
jgi:hypothetical protein